MSNIFFSTFFVLSGVFKKKEKHKDMSDRLTHFRDWLNQRYTPVLSKEDKEGAIAFFLQHYKGVEAWCDEVNEGNKNQGNKTEANKNGANKTEANKNGANTKEVRYPSMLPYCSFLWQWSANMGKTKVTDQIKLPINQRVQIELDICWSRILGSSYTSFIFDEIVNE